MDADQYLSMCEQMGWEPKEEELPKDPAHLSYNVQCALVLFNALPDSYAGMSGVWVGKDYSALSTIMNIFQFDNKIQIFTLLKVAEHEYSKWSSEKTKQQESLDKAKRGR
jgi:hypothetical protein